uniref:Aspartokinase n=1 Tax=Pyramimonas obovata TaxID=1411642 RepID=A0A7S0RMN7_9CHLO
MALKTPAKEMKDLEPLQAIVKLHMDTMDELRVEDSVREEIEYLLGELQQLLSAISIMQELTPRMRANLVSYGERMSTRIFASFLRTQGLEAKQCDAAAIGFACTDEDYEAGEVLPETYPALKRALTRQAGERGYIPIITGFLAKGKSTGAICTLGRGGSDLSATVVGAALQLSEVQVWKDVDGVLSADPRRIPGAIPVPFLTYEEATELAYFGAQVLHPHAMRPAMDSAGALSVRVKNSYNITAPGTLITQTRAASELYVLTSIVVKEDITILDIESTRMLGQYGFLARVFAVLNNHKLSVDMMATSEVSVSVTLDPVKFWDRELEDEELQALSEDLSQYARLNVKKGFTILSLIGQSAEDSSTTLHRAFHALDQAGVNVVMVSKGASKVNVSLVVDGEATDSALEALHEEFFSGRPFCGYEAKPCTADFDSN